MAPFHFFNVQLQVEREAKYIAMRNNFLFKNAMKYPSWPNVLTSETSLPKYGTHVIAVTNFQQTGINRKTHYLE